MKKLNGNLTDEIRLDLNENLFLPEKYYNSILGELNIDISIYPSEYGAPLCNKLADHYNLIPERFMIANGSDMVLDTIFKSVVPEKGTLGYFVPSYSYYDFFARRNNLKVIEIPLNNDFSVPSSTSYLDELDTLVLCSPNNPTGLEVDRNHIESILNHDLTLIIDEAYVEYCEQNCLNLLNKYSNLILIRTFSKAWGLAGVRVGYAISSPEKIMEIREDMIPFNVSTPSIEITKKALDHSDIVKNAVETTIEEREWLDKELENVGFNTLPSSTNFIF